MRLRARTIATLPTVPSPRNRVTPLSSPDRFTITSRSGGSTLHAFTRRIRASSRQDSV
jgi:hypothetical protein